MVCPVSDDIGNCFCDFKNQFELLYNVPALFVPSKAQITVNLAKKGNEKFPIFTVFCGNGISLMIIN